MRVTGNLYCLLPHVLFAQLGQRARPVFDKLFGTEAERMDFMGELQRTGREVPEGARGRVHRQWLRDHPVLASTPPALCVPIGMHGDGGEMHSGEKVMVLSWGGICNPGATLDTRILFTVIKESVAEAEAHATLFAAFEVISWSMNALAAGVHPSVDHAGKPFGPTHWPRMAALAGSQLTSCGLKGAWMELRGDWQFLRAALNLQHHYNATQVCHLCAATSRGLGYFGDHFGQDSPMRQTLVTPRTWSSGTPKSPLCQIMGFNIWRCSFDAMHTLELGLLQRVIPAALREMMGMTRAAGIFGDGTTAARCAAATRAYHQWARDAKVSSSARIKAITRGWVQGQQPHLSQSHAKAAALRAMLPWLVQLCEDQAAASPQRAVLMRELLSMDIVWRQAPRFMQNSQATAAAAHCERALAALAVLAQQPGSAWRLTPKAHALTHLAYDSGLGNPRAAHCYQDEDFVGRVKRIYVRCHGRSAPLRAVQRYALHMALRLHARQELILGIRGSSARSRGPPTPGRLRARGTALAMGAIGLAPAQGVKRGRGRPRIMRRR